MKINKKFMRNRMQLFKSKILLLLPLLLSISCQQEIIQSYTSENLEIKKISEHCYVHITYLETEEYGRVACNGMLVVDEDEVLVFDTPTSEKVSRELLDFLENDWNKKVVGVVINHFHVDCLGGLKSFHDKGIPSYAQSKTLELSLGDEYAKPQQGFQNNLELKVGDEKVLNTFIGPGHTEDNIVSYFAADHVLFGGCFVKSLKAGKGNLADANLLEWSNSIEKTKSQFPNAKIVIPGHGDYGGPELLDYTAKMFELKKIKKLSF